MPYLASLQSYLRDSLALQVFLSLVALASTHAILVDMGFWRKKLDVKGKVS